MSGIIYTELGAEFVSKAYSELSSPGTATARSYSLKDEILIFAVNGDDYFFDFESDDTFTTYGLGIKYAAVKLNDFVMFTYKIPGERTSVFTFIWDTGTNLVTMIENRFDLDSQDHIREVKREISFGYNKELDNAPEALHRLENRILDKAIVWDNTLGERTLEIYNGTDYSSFIRHDLKGSGVDPIKVPTDYIKLSDNTYAVARTEAGLSGAFYIQLIDIQFLSETALKLGFDENDDLWYCLFDGESELAQLK